MTDQDRILKLLAQGKISKEEAGELLEVLDTDEYSPDLPEVTPVDIPVPPLPPQPELPIPPELPALAWHQTDSEETALPGSSGRGHMLNISAISGDISVFTDAKLKEPQIDSEGKVKIRQGVERWEISVERDDLTVILPSHWGLGLNVQSGDITIRDVMSVQGSVVSGDIRLENSGSVDLSVDSGDIYLERAEALKLKVLSGDIRLEDIDTVECSLDSGDISAERIQVLKGHVISGDVHVEDIGVLDISVDNGDVHAERVALLKSRVISGDVEAEYINSLDVRIDQGDFNGNALLQEGSHVLCVCSGDVSLALLEGSSVLYKTTVTSGDLEVTTSEGTYTAEDSSYEGKIADGLAQLKLEVDSGSLSLSTGKNRSKKQAAFNINGQPFEFNFDFSKTFDFGPKQVETPPGLKWIQVDSWAGDAHISSDASLTVPQSNVGKVQKNQDGSWKVSGLTDDFNLKIPPGYGVNLSIKAGDVSIRDIPFVKGRVFAGDFHASNIEGIDVFVAAGDVSASLLLKEGRHHLTAAAGNLSLRFLKGSSVTYQGSNGLGGFGRNFNGVVGEGQAQMTFRTLVAEVDVVEA